jgi:peptide/nickel transport system substrate-binding protein
VEPQQRLQLTGDAQRYLIENAYVIPCLSSQAL